jgi:hypothetical protein
MTRGMLLGGISVLVLCWASIMSVIVFAAFRGPF